MGGERRVTFCRICEAACGLEVMVERDAQGQRVVSIRPDPEHVSSRGYACVKGVSYDAVHNSPDRLRRPLKRGPDGAWIEIGWPQALREIGAKVRELRDRHGGDSIAMFIGNPAAFNITHSLALYGFMQGIGSRNLYSSGSQDCNNKFLVAQRMYGAPALQPIPDIDRTGCLIALGTNPAVSHASFVHLPRPIGRLKAIEKRGGSVWLVNPRRTETARVVGSHVFIRPGTDVFLLLGLLSELVTRGAVNTGRVERFMAGWGDVEDCVRPWTAARVAKVTGIPEETIRAMADDYIAASAPGGPGAAVYCSTGVNQGGHGTLAYWLLNVINAVSGNLDRAGGVVVPRGIVDLPRLMRRAGIGVRSDRSRIGGFEAIMDTFPAGVLPDEIAIEGAGQIRGMFVSAGNPLLSCPDEASMRAALEKLELLVCVDMFRNETGNLAHYVLPAMSFLERPDIPLSSHGFSPELLVQYTEPVVPADGEQKDEWWIYGELARACGVRMFDSRLLATGMALGRLHPRLRLDSAAVMKGLLTLSRRPGVSPGVARTHPHGLALEPETPDFLARRVMTESGRVELAPPDFVLAARESLEPAFARHERSLARGQLRLISRRERHGHNSWMHNVESFVKGARGRNHLDMHPDDAARVGLAEGDTARVTGEVGAIELPVRLTEDLIPGAVAAPHGWGHADADGLRVAQRAAGVNVNRVAAGGAGSLEPLSGMARLTAVPVDVTPASPK